MTTEQALNILQQALDLAAKAGVYGIKDSVAINTALTVLSTPAVEEEEEE